MVDSQLVSSAEADSLTEQSLTEQSLTEQSLTENANDEVEDKRKNGGKKKKRKSKGKGFGIPLLKSKLQKDWKKVGGTAILCVLMGFLMIKTIPKKQPEIPKFDPTLKISNAPLPRFEFRLPGSIIPSADILQEIQELHKQIIDGEKEKSRIKIENLQMIEGCETFNESELGQYKYLVHIRTSYNLDTFRASNIVDESGQILKKCTALLHSGTGPNGAKNYEDFAKQICPGESPAECRRKFGISKYVMEGNIHEGGKDCELMVLEGHHVGVETLRDEIKNFQTKLYIAKKMVSIILYINSNNYVARRANISAFGVFDDGSISVSDLLHVTSEGREVSGYTIDELKFPHLYKAHSNKEKHTTTHKTDLFNLGTALHNLLLKRVVQYKDESDNIVWGDDLNNAKLSGKIKVDTSFLESCTYLDTDWKELITKLLNINDEERPDWRMLVEKYGHLLD